MLAPHLLALLTIAQQAPTTSPATAPSAVLVARDDSLAHVRDTALLRGQFRLAHHAAGRLPTTEAHLHEGQIALRLATLGADSSHRLARAAFERAVRSDPSNPRAWHGLALAHEGRARWHQATRENLGTRVGIGAMEEAARAMARALDADPAFAPAALGLARLTEELRDTTLTRQTRDRLRTTVAVGAGPPELLHALGRLERATGDADSAGTRFQAFVAAGGNRALGLLEDVRAKLAAGRDADSVYYAGAALDDSVAVAGYRADLAPIADDAVLAELDRARGEARATLLRRFWTDRDHLDLRTPGERLREHYRRLAYARAHFRLTINRRYYGWRDAYRSGSDEFDDRGIVYLRHGEPDLRLRPFVFGAMPNESWRYMTPEGELHLHFSAGGDPSDGGGDLYDYRLVQSVTDLRGSGMPVDHLLLSREALSPAYARMLHWGPYGAARMARLERRMGRASVVASTTTDSYLLRFGQTLTGEGTLVGVGGDATGSAAQFVFALADSNLTAERVPDGVRYAIRVRLNAFDGAARLAAALDTTLHLAAPAPLPRGSHLLGHVAVPLPAGTWAYRAALSQSDSTGTILRQADVTVPRTDGTALALSDLALGTEALAVRWTPVPGDTAYLTPFATYRRADPLELYYELHGATTGTSYRHEITIVRRRPGQREEGRPSLSLAFSEPAAASPARLRRTIRLDRFREGDYVLRVRVRGPRGEVLARERAFSVTGDR